MKKLHRLSCLIGLFVATNSILATQAHAIATKDEPNSFKITGKFLLRGFYDFKNYEGQSDFAPAAIPLVEDETNKKCAGFDMPDAGLGLKKSFPLGDNAKALEFVLQTKLSTEGLKLKRIYLDHDNFRVGLAASNFCDLAALPDTLTDAPGCAVGGNALQLVLKHQLEGGLSYGIAAEKPLALVIYPKAEKNEKATPDSKAQDAKAQEKLTYINNIPALSAHVKFEKSFGYVRVGGLLMTLDYYEKDAKKTNYKLACGANLTSTLKLIPDQTTLKLGAIYGMGIGNYLVDLASTPKKEHKNVYIKPGTETELMLIGTWGAYGGIEHHWLPKLRSTIAYSILNTVDTEREDDAYKQGHYASGNLTYHPTDHLMFGVEYLYGKRFTIADKSQDAQRVQAVVGFTL